MSDQTLVMLFVVLGLVTYVTRIGGYFIARRITVSGRLKAGLEAVPGAILLGLVVPAVTNGGLSAWVGLLATFGLSALRVPAAVIVIVAVGTVAGLRQVGV